MWGGFKKKVRHQAILKMIQQKKFVREQIYEGAGVSRQGYFQSCKQQQKEEKVEQILMERITKIRTKHRQMGSRVLFHKAGIAEMGITKFEQFMSESGMTVQQKRKWIRTTIAGNRVYPNLINGLVLDDINQLVVGDITYYISRNNTYYVFTLKDAYSKRIVGLHGSDHLFAEEAGYPLHQLFELRKGMDFSKLIHHTDRGSQYGSDYYTNLLLNKDIQISMAKTCLENGMAEQLNGIIKNDYLRFESINKLHQFKTCLKSIQQLINEKPVKELNYMTPIEFDEYIISVPKNSRPKVVLHNFNKYPKGGI